MWETIREYLTFTRKERYGVLFLLLIICLLFILPHLLRPGVGDPDPLAYKKLEKATMELDNQWRDSAVLSVNRKRYEHPKYDAPALYHGVSQNPASVVMFYFDPNRISAADWQRLGLTPRLSQTIIHYIERGGHFHKAEELKKIYGILPGDFNRLIPYVRIGEMPGDFHHRMQTDGKSSSSVVPPGHTDTLFRGNPITKNYEFAWAVKKPEITDINQADSAVWCRLPGIGPKLAFRIVKFREKLGGFCCIEQVGETFGLSDSVFQKIKPFLRLGTGQLTQIDINTASAETLQVHPYIRWKLAKMIVDYRNQHGQYHVVGELLQLALMDSVIFKKLIPYIVVK
jgi:competence protein ComEA